MKSTLADFWPDWELGETIGEGVRGIVCRAWKKEDRNKQAAVKIIEGVWNADRLRKEILCLQQLKDEPSVVRVDDFAAVPREDGRMDVYIRMELLTPLMDYFSGRDPEEAEIARMGFQLCEALARCHGLGILHQDIKPGNILVDARDPENIRFKLSDFSESEFLNGAEPLSEDSLPRIHGTMDYIAPEAEKGHPEKRSDLYSLGLTLYRFLNHGKLPFMPERRILGEDDRRAGNRIRLSGMALPAPAEASPAMAEVILKACAFRPEDRYESAEAMAAALKAVLHPKANKKAGPWRRWIWAAAACLVLAAGLFLARPGTSSVPESPQADKTAAASAGSADAGDSGRQPGAETAADTPADPGAESPSDASAGLDAKAFQAVLDRFDASFAAMDTAQLPASLSDFPLVMEAWRYAPQLRAESADAWILRLEEQETVRWALRAEAEEGTILPGAFDPDRQAWVFSPEQRAAAGKLVVSKSAGCLNIDYDYSPESLELSRIAVWEQSADQSSSLQFNVTVQGEPDYLCILRNLDGLRLRAYGPDGSPVPEDSVFSRLESRAASLYPVWKEQFEPALRSGRFCFPALWTEVPFALSPEDAPEIQVEESGGAALIRVSEHVPPAWRLLTGNGIPVAITPCSWDSEKGAWAASVPFDRIRLLREGAPDSLSLLVDYERGNHFLPGGPVLSLDLQEEDESLSFNCYLLGTARAGQGGVFAQIRNEDAFYAFYDSQGNLDHYNNDTTGCVYGPDGSLREGTEPEGYRNPVEIALP